MFAFPGVNAARQIASGALVVAALVVSGCGSRETPADRAVADGVMIQSLGAQNPNLDPLRASLVLERNLLLALFEGLVAADPQTGAPRPAAAESWDISDDGLAYTFHLRPEGRWSNGDPVTAQDFANSVQRVLEPRSGAVNARFMHVLRGARAYNAGETDSFASVGVEVIDAHTLRFLLEAPYRHFLPLLTHWIWLPVHLPSIREVGDPYSRETNWTTPEHLVGNGPYRLTEVQPEQRIAVEKNPFYRDADNVVLRAIDYRNYSVDTEERAFRGGQVHITDALPIGRLKMYREERPEALRVTPSYAVYFYRINVTRPPFDDPRVRRALSAAINRETLTRYLLSGAQTPARSFTPPGPAGYHPPELVADDADEARHLLAEAGFPKGKGWAGAELLFNTSESHQSIAEAIQAMWQTELGITVQLANQENGVFLSNRQQLNYDISRASWFADYLDPLSFLMTMTTDNPDNQTGWSNADYDRLVAAATVEAEAGRRLEDFREAESILLNEAPIIPIYVYSTVRLVDERVEGWIDNPLDVHPPQLLRFSSPMPTP